MLKKTPTEIGASSKKNTSPQDLLSRFENRQRIEHFLAPSSKLSSAAASLKFNLSISPSNGLSMLFGNYFLC